MKVLGLVWVGVRTDRFEQTATFFRDVLGVPMEIRASDFGWAKLPDTSQFEVFGTTEPEHDHFTTGPVPEFLVDDLPTALGELRAAGVDILGEPVVRGREGWCHFRAPDGNVYGLTAGADYRRGTFGQ